MDTTIEYVEMCRKAEEIQHDWKFKDGDYIFGLAKTFKRNPHAKPGVECWSGYSAGDWPGYPQDGIWLPRQDQLQDMVVSKKAQYVNGLPYITFIELFHQFVKKCWHQFNSMEQLWLSYVMHEKYGKCWDGTDWVVE